MSKRYNDGSHYENHPRAAELHEGAAHAHGVGERHGQQEHLTGSEHSRQELEHSELEHSPAHQNGHGGTVGHGIASFGHEETAALAFELWRARGCPEGSPDEDWYRAVEELRARACGH
jgi:hypothetical protein